MEPLLPLAQQRSRTGKALFICSFSVLSLFLGFFGNYWRVVDQQWFDGFQRDGESFTIGRMVKSRQDGIFSDGGMTGFGSLNATPVEYSNYSISDQYLAYINGLSFGAYTRYQSEIGGQGMLFSILDRLMTLSSREKLRLFHGFTSLMSAIALTSIVFWFYLEFGLTVALFVLTSAVFSQWLVVFGRNIGWSLWAFYVPVGVIMHYLKFKSGLRNLQPFSFGGIIFITTLLKCLFNGYAYITSTLLMMIVPFIYYSILCALSVRKFFTGLSTAAFSSCLAILLSFLILCFQIASVEGDFLAGVNHIVNSFLKRTHASPDKFGSLFFAGLEASTIHVLVTYLKATFFDASNYLPCSNPWVCEYLFRIRYLYLIVLFLIMSAALYSLRNGYGIEKNGARKHIALIVATWFSMLAPLSWFIVFKAHSYVHTEMNEIVWQMPFVFFGFAICGLVIRISVPYLIGLARRSA